MQFQKYFSTKILLILQKNKRFLDKIVPLLKPIVWELC